MRKTLNILDSKHIIDDLNVFKKKDYGNKEIRICNTSLRKILDCNNLPIFDKNDAFIEANTLFRLMQPMGNNDVHNSHNLTPNEIVEALKSLKNTEYVYLSYEQRYVILSLVIASCGNPIIVVIDKHAFLKNNKNEYINKIITIYPKNNLKKDLHKNLVKKS